MLLKFISICEYKSIYLQVDWYASWISPISCKMSRIQCGKRKATLGVIWTYGGVWIVYMYFRFDPSRKSNLKKEIVTTTPISFYTIILVKIFCTFLYICIIVWYMSTYFFLSIIWTDAASQIQIYTQLVLCPSIQAIHLLINPGTIIDMPVLNIIEGLKRMKS